MMLGILFAIFLVFLFMGMPVAYAMSISAVVTLFFDNSLPGLIIPQKMFTAMDSFSLMAIPFFMLAGVIMSTGGGSRALWVADMEHGGYDSTNSSRNNSSDNIFMAWRAGAKLTMMEGSAALRFGTGLKHKWYTGGADASYENVSLVDANNKVVPAPTQGWADGGAMFSNNAAVREDIKKRIESGELQCVGQLPLGFAAQLSVAGDLRTADVISSVLGLVGEHGSPPR